MHHWRVGGLPAIGPSPPEVPVTLARLLSAAVVLAVTPLPASGPSPTCLDRVIAQCDALYDPAAAWLTPIRGWCYLIGLNACQLA